MTIEFAIANQLFKVGRNDIADVAETLHRQGYDAIKVMLETDNIDTIDTESQWKKVMNRLDAIKKRENL